MGQSCGHQPVDSLDTVITNAVIIDYSGIYKADIGIRGGLIAAIGKAGNPDVMNNVHADMIIGVSFILRIKHCINFSCTEMILLHITSQKESIHMGNYSITNNSHSWPPRDFHMNIGQSQQCIKIPK